MACGLRPCGAYRAGGRGVLGSPGSHEVQGRSEIALVSRNTCLLPLQCSRVGRDQLWGAGALGSRLCCSAYLRALAELATGATCPHRIQRPYSLAAARVPAAKRISAGTRAYAGTLCY